ncbi:class I SAM-dependent methyltransferase [Polymorphospora rubra]|uniref:class I SAM-dependent methyltransferase n=1 Tax=Polymorphospora rubra TaxID=338584 RepID=UPI0033CD1D37
MTNLASQRRYWDTVGATKTFTHPIDPGWLAGIERSARVLDYGCGYGRVMAELSDQGFTAVSGVDVSPVLIQRGRQLRPDLNFTVIESPPELGYGPASFDVVLLFAVLTCIPDDETQRALITELSRLLAPRGVIYVSDLVLQPDERNRRRYAAYAEQFGTPYGVFATDDGAVCRHHDVKHLRALFDGFHLVNERRIEVTTMNGHRSEAVQLLAVKR